MMYTGGATRLIAVVLLAASATVPVKAQDAAKPALSTGSTTLPVTSVAKIDAKKEKSIRELLEVTGASKLGAQVGQEAIAYFRRAAPPGVPEEYWKKAEAKFTDMSEVIEETVRIYDKHYTQGDIDAFLVFYRSPAGQKFVKELPAVQTESTAFGRAWGKRKAEEIVAEIDAIQPKPSAPVAFDKKPFKSSGKVIKTASGLQYDDMTVGKGAVAVAGKTCVMHYTGTLANGTKFDSSRDSGKAFEFGLGAGQVIKGWDEGIVGMRVGGRRKLIIPAKIGYGASGTPGGPIPPNAVLTFDVELIDVR